MVGRLAGKVAVVTGAGRNIGRAEAMALAAEGASILVNDLSGAEETVEAIRAAGGEAAAEASNAGSWAGAEAIVAAAIAAFGRVDILVNNAGVVRPGPIQEMSEAAWDAVVDVSLKGYAALIRFAAPHMIAQGEGGVIVNTGSTSGLGHVIMSNYAAAKEGAAGLTRSVARDLGRYGIRCNLIRPINHVSSMVTPELMRSLEISAELGFPLNGSKHFTTGVLATGDHVAALVTLLCLPPAAHVSGEEFYVQGDQVGRFYQPDLAAAEFHAGGWTLEALETPAVLENLLGPPSRFLKRA
jgi:NAD(P)-dependent dehydrogenase (short-subunit alcohol dehydrogenase family)